MNKKINWIFLILSVLASCKGQNQIEGPKNNIQTESELKDKAILIKTDTLKYSNAPNNITRTIIQDKIGNIWFATFEGVFKYDGISFTNVTKDVSKSRFFSVLEDSKGNLWFGSIGSGVYRYDGKYFQNFTTDDGLINNEIVCIYEDKAGKIWLGANGGLSIYNGNFFQNYMITGDTIVEDKTGKVVPNLQRPTNEVNSIIEDKMGKFWLGTKGNTFIYDGKSFVTVSESGKPFTNVRWIIEDKKGNIWLGGNNGLWYYNGITFNNVTKDFVGYIYEDRKGNIWTSSQKISGWALSYYKAMPIVEGVKRTATDIKTGEGMFFGITEDSTGNIWSGTLNGVCRYDGSKLEYFRK